MISWNILAIYEQFGDENKLQGVYIMGNWLEHWCGIWFSNNGKFTNVLILATIASQHNYSYVTPKNLFSINVQYLPRINYIVV